ncbi:MAG TPA: hypothetical protein DER40_08970 [Geobacter sp.]|nr:hypothetical protein [Geobacter sp.]
MIKKLVTFITAAMLILALSGNALAEFADLHLIRIYYDRAGDEIATDLGLVKDILATPSSTFPGSFGSLSTGYSVYFALDRTTGMSDLWATGSTTTPSTIIGTSLGLTSLKSGTTYMYSWYNGFAIGDTYTGAASAINSFKNKLSATQGNLANSIAAVSRLNTEASIAGLITNGSGSVTQTLYFWDNALTTVASEKIGVAVATITTNFDGTTTISNQVADSFPPAVTINTPPLSPSTSATVSISFTATDAVGVTGYLLNESETPPLADDAGWVAVTPSTSFSTATPIDYTFSGLVPGVLTTKWLYVWAKDAAGNVSAQVGSYTDITIPAGGATPVITWATPAAITYGTALSSTQLNATASDPVTAASIPGTFDYTPALGTILSAGTQALSVTFTPTDTVAYTAANSMVNLTVNQATPTITWATPTAITYGTPLSATQLNATASVPGTFAYNVAPGDVLAAGIQTLSVIFTPTDTVNYSTATTSVNLVVNKAALSVTANNLSKMVNTVNPTLTYTITGFVNTETTAVLSGTPTLSTTAVTNSPVGSYPITVTTGTLAAANYSFSFVNGTLTVTGQTVPTVTWNTPATITYGTALSATQLNATASVPGTFAYTPAAGSVPNAGTQTLSVTFTPTDSVNYSTVTDSVNLVVNKVALTVTANNLSKMLNTDNPTLTYTVTGFVNGETTAVLTGAPVLSTTAVTNSPLGSYPITITAGTLTAGNYNFSFVNGTLTVTSINLIQNPVMILGDKGYATLLAAIQSVTADATILVRDTYTSALPETLLLNNGYNVTLNGGIDVNGNPTTGYSTVHGTLTIQSGALVVNGVAIW